MKYIIALFFLVIFVNNPYTQVNSERRIEPPNWWAGMKNENLQLMLYAPNIANYRKVEVNSPAIRIHGIRSVESPNYIFVDLKLDPDLEPGTYQFTLTGTESDFVFDYEFKSRRSGSSGRESFNSSDVIYLLMPDRFANGDPSNDSVDDAIEQVNRDFRGGRHGGDIKGIIDHLDYLNDLGITTIWSTPLLLDDEKSYSYHTYAIADYYKIDPRYGTNEDYRSLAIKCHEKGIKLIMDMVTNHCGISHWWMKDLPQSDWVHPFPEFTRSNHRKATLNDPYVSTSDYDLYNEGWFDTTMPDLDQSNELLLNYLIQNAIWWIEFADLDGLRVDTYPYNEKWSIAQWSKAILDEYPNLNIVGECWQHRPSELAYWQSGVQNYDGYDSYLPAGMDFCLTDAFEKAFNEDDQHWDLGMARFYQSLATDYLYYDAYNLLIFFDNHDITRYAGLVGNDINKYKLALSFLLTTRGIPQIYYGTEIMMEGNKSIGDGDIRRDFPGGWQGDERDAFTSEGRNNRENEVFQHMRTLLRWRKENPVIHTGKMVHYIPENNIYVYFRYDDSKKVMVILNNNDSDKKVSLNRYSEQMIGYKSGKEILSNKMILDLSSIELKAKSAAIIELSKDEK